jgi:predicted nucleic acid-binding protein
VRKPAELRGLFKGIGTGHRKGVGSIVNVVDSSAWLEYLVDSERASLFAQPIEQTQELIVPVLVIYELFKKVLRERGEQPALEIYGLLS